MPAESKVKSWVIGCGVTLAGAAFVVGLVLFAGYWWVSTPGPQVDSKGFIGPETVGLIDFDHPFQDDGMRELAVSVNLEANRNQAENFKELSKPLALLATFFQPDRGDIEAKLERDSPRQVTALLESIDGHDLQPAVVVNFNRFPRLLRIGATLYGRFSEDGLAYGDYLLIPFDGGWLTFVDNTVVWAGNERALQQILDRLDEASRGARIARSDPRWDVFARIENRAGSFSYLLEFWDEKAGDTLPSPPGLALLLRAMRELRLAVDVTSDDSATVSLEADCGEGLDCRVWGESLRTVLATESAKRDSPLKTFRLNHGESFVHSELELAGFRGRMVDLFSRNPKLEELLDKARRSKQRRHSPSRE